MGAGDLEDGEYGAGMAGDVAEVRAARLIAAASAFLWAVVFYGIVDLSTAVTQQEGFEHSFVLDAGWGLLFTVMVAVPLVSLAVRPGQAAPLLHLLLVVVSLTAAATASQSWGLLLPAALLGLTVAFLADLARGSVRPPGGWKLPALDPVVAAVAVPAALAWLSYAAEVTQSARVDACPRVVTVELNHWPAQAALGASLALVAVAAAAGVRQRWPGTILSVACVCVASTWLAVVSLAFPALGGALARSEAIAALVWSAALLFVSAARLWQHRPTERGPVRT